jgi:hypothetical protein
MGSSPAHAAFIKIPLRFTPLWEMVYSRVNQGVELERFDKEQSTGSCHPYRSDFINNFYE